MCHILVTFSLLQRPEHGIRQHRQPWVPWKGAARDITQACSHHWCCSFQEHLLPVKGRHTGLTQPQQDQSLLSRVQGPSGACSSHLPAPLSFPLPMLHPRHGMARFPLQPSPGLVLRTMPRTRTR